MTFLRRYFAAKPRYEIEQRVGPLEIRRYEPRVVAHTESERDFIGAMHEGAELLTRFAQGDNETSTVVRASEPYTAAPIATNQEYVISMEMPAGHEPPRPTDPRVKIDTVPARRVAALRFRGAVSASRAKTMASELLRLLRNAGLDADGETSFATYDAPSVMPLLRRNEVWVTLA